MEDCTALAKDCVLYCLRGEATVTVMDEEIHLREGELMGFSNKDLTEMRPAVPLGPKDPPVLLLWVGGNRVGKIPKNRAWVDATD